VTRAATIAAVLSLAVVAGCGEDETAEDIRGATGATTQSPAPGQGTGPSTAGAEALAADATRARDRLLAIARQTLEGKPGQSTDPRLVRDAWQAAGFTPVAPVEQARPGTVSPRAALDFFPTANDKQIPAPSNPFEYWFVVSDSSGQCQGGAIRGYPNLEEFFPFSPPQRGAQCAGARIDRASLGR
jgi:hypothetical protein